MKKKTSKLFAVVFSLIMAITAVVPAFATETSKNETLLTPTTKGSITMTDADEGDTFYAYQVMKVVYDSNTNVASYVPTAAFAAFLASDKNSQKTTIDTFDKYIKLTSDSPEMKQLVGDFSAYCKDPGVAESFTLSANVTKTDVELGQYVINGVSTTAQNVFQVMTASFPVTVATEGANKDSYVVNDTVEITVKKDKPTIDKSIPSNDTQYAIGQYVDYQIITTVPTYPAEAIRKTYKIGDVCDSTLTFDYEAPHVIVVNASTTGEEGTFTTKLTEGTDYTITKKLAHEFELTFVYDNIEAYKSIQVLYFAEVNADAVVTDPNNNTAHLTYSTDPYDHDSHDETIEDKEKVYTYGLEITKVDAEDETIKLEGVEFELYSGEDKIEFVKVGNDYRVADSEDAPEDIITTLVTDANGMFNIIGLDVGTYSLKETKSFAGYALPTTDYTVIITDADKDGLVEDEEEVEGTTGTIDYTLTNNKITTILPSTGGVGTLVFISIGLVGMVVAVVTFAVLKKKSKNVQ